MRWNKTAWFPVVLQNYLKPRQQYVKTKLKEQLKAPFTVVSFVSILSRTDCSLRQRANNHNQTLFCNLNLSPIIYKQKALSPLSDEHNQCSQKFPASMKISTSLLIEIRSIEKMLSNNCRFAYILQHCTKKEKQSSTFTCVYNWHCYLSSGILVPDEDYRLCKRAKQKVSAHISQ